jgi:hypothetical protein
MGTDHDSEAADPDAAVEGQVEMHSVDRTCQLEVDNSCLSSINSGLVTIRRKATENFHSSLRFRNRSVIYIRNISS